jgi:hypothetical protein
VQQVQLAQLEQQVQLDLQVQQVQQDRKVKVLLFWEPFLALMICPQQETQAMVI